MTTNADDALFAKAEGIEWMATDEIAEFRIARSEKEIGALHAAAYRRRAKLCELDQRRVCQSNGDPRAIQAVFDRVGLPSTFANAISPFL